MKITITDNFNELDIVMMIENPWAECYLSITHSPSDTSLIDSLFKNVLILSANLRDTLGLGPSIDFLEKHEIPKTHPIWDLNHSDMWIKNG